MFKMSTPNVKEPKHYSKRVGHEVRGVVAVLLSSKCGWLGGDVLKRLVAYEVRVTLRTQKQPLWDSAMLKHLIEDELLLLRHHPRTSRY